MTDQKRLQILVDCLLDTTGKPNRSSLFGALLGDVGCTTGPPTQAQLEAMMETNRKLNEGLRLGTVTTKDDLAALHAVDDVRWLLGMVDGWTVKGAAPESGEGATDA